jgi:hypothetical protein
MRKLPYLLVLLLLSLLLLAAAASAHALTLPATGPTALTAPAHDEEDEADDEGEEAEEGDESEDCEAEEDELCEEELEAEDEECVIEDASPSVVVAPGNQKVLLTIHYHSFESTMVTIDARLHGGKGGLHLGSEQARFRRAGAFHDSFSLGPKQLRKALAAREFDVDLHAVGTPADCELHLSTRGSHRAK